MPEPGAPLSQQVYSTPLAQRRAVATGALAPSAAAVTRRAALTARAQARVAAPAAIPEGMELRQAGLIPDVQDLFDRDWGEWWETMTGGITQPGPAAPFGGAAPAITPAPGEMPVMEAGVGLAALGVAAPWLLRALGLGGLAAGVGIGAEALLTGEGQFIPGTMIPLGGPLLAEPPAAMVAKEWNTGTAQFYQLIDGRIAVYSKKKKTWKAYRPAKHIVVSRNPRMGTLLRASKRIDKLWTGINKKAGKYLKKKVVYGIPPAQALSALERKAIRG